MIHGDITYTDEALYANKLSVVFEDKDKARETLDNVREFIKNNPTVYLSTHTPLGPENLENKKIMDLDNQPDTIYPYRDIFFYFFDNRLCRILFFIIILLLFF